MTRTDALIAVASIAMLAACSGSDGLARVSGPDPVTAPSITSTPDTTQPEPEPASPATTDSSPTTNTATTPTATIAPDSIAELRRAVQLDFEKSEIVFLAAFASPDSDESRSLLMTHFDEDILAKLLQDLDTLADDGLRGKPNSAVPQAVQLLDDPVGVNNDATRISARTCRVDAGIVFLPGSSPESDVVINDTVRRITSITEFVFKNGVWKLATGIELTNRVGETSCDGA
jgi:hypothetical protein